jgi:hypothetical protein
LNLTREAPKVAATLAVTEFFKSKDFHRMDSHNLNIISGERDAQISELGLRFIAHILSRARDGYLRNVRNGKRRVFRRLRQSPGWHGANGF